jgi:hypothetical protein
VAEKVTVTVRASGAHPDVLTVQDAMRQVLDIFDLLTDGPEGIEWKLVKASTNTPFSAEGEAISFEKAVDVSVLARTQKNFVAQGLREMERGFVPDGWDQKRLNKAKQLFKRNLNGVGSTTIDFEGCESILVTPALAATAVGALEEKSASDLYDLPVGREETGSIEGVLTYLGESKGFPAIAILDSRTKSRVWCRLSEDLQAKLADKAAFDDFWKHQRVIVRGKIRYDKSGDIAFVVAFDLMRIETRNVPLSAIKDSDFTGGLSISEYLDRFREGALG